jgi:hypothetical protein
VGSGVKSFFYEPYQGEVIVPLTLLLPNGVDVVLSCCRCLVFLPPCFLFVIP